ncbi:hypothetical protein SYK_05090 [Pseudodesulfovibrio nedwellii]|uniref:Uncharacterized protein n=1 Tax=Pseudodesulfovibrio nedwellii TaxID=2973072 RepID=A0ABM8AXA2_9BACT|nr:hypothetical protein [Pseudodesulfovibrio nedwellii]BDQ36149.1 hypothetical protein SYK_05090 [Pseudodesulfovibrio nedwellii]
MIKNMDLTRKNLWNLKPFPLQPSVWKRKKQMRELIIETKIDLRIIRHRIENLLDYDPMATALCYGGQTGRAA